MTLHIQTHTSYTVEAALCDHFGTDWDSDTMNRMITINRKIYSLSFTK